MALPRALSLFLGVACAAGCTRGPRIVAEAERAGGALPPASAAPDAAAAPEVAPEGSDAGPENELVAAVEAARAKGLRSGVMFMEVGPCPTIPSPRADPAVLAAHGALAGLVVDVDGFLRDDIGVPEAVALLGPPVLCQPEKGDGFLDMELAPRSPALHEVMLETEDGDLIGIVLEYVDPVPVDLAALARFGPHRQDANHFEAPRAGWDIFATSSAVFTGQLMLEHVSFREPESRRMVARVIHRRFSRREQLPKTYFAQADILPVVALALRALPPAPVAFLGSVGVFDHEAGDTVFLNQTPDDNVLAATIQKRDVPLHPGGPPGPRVRGLDLAFTTPVPTDAASLARDLGAALQVPPPRVVVEGTRVRLVVADGAAGTRGTVTLELAGRGAVQRVRVERAVSP